MGYSRAASPKQTATDGKTLITTTELGVMNSEVKGRRTATVTPIATDGPTAADMLPFVQKRYDGKGHIWWNMPTTGDYTQDCNMGTWMAEAYLAEMRRQPEHWLLGRIVREMVRSGAADGHVVGFMSRLSSRLMKG